MISSPTQHWTTLGVSWARVMILTQDLSMLEKRFASCQNMGVKMERKGWGKEERRGKRNLLAELAPVIFSQVITRVQPQRFFSLEKHKSFCSHNTAYFILHCQACYQLFLPIILRVKHTKRLMLELHDPNLKSFSKNWITSNSKSNIEKFKTSIPSKTAGATRLLVSTTRLT